MEYALADVVLFSISFLRLQLSPWNLRPHMHGQQPDTLLRQGVRGVARNNLLPIEFFFFFESAD